MNVHPLYRSENGQSNGLPKHREFEIPGNVTFALPGFDETGPVTVHFRHDFVHCDKNKMIDTLARTSLFAFALLIGVIVAFLVLH